GVLPQNHELFRQADPYGKASLEECVNTIATLPLLHQPDAMFTYGAQTNFVGRIVEIISGEKLDQYVTKNILNPLKMANTSWIVPEADTVKLATGYSGDGNLAIAFAPQRQSMPYALGTNGLSSTTEDYFRFAQMLLNGGELDGARILKSETVKLMTTDQLPEALHPLNAIGAPFPNTGFGLGIAVLNGDPKNWEPAEFSFPNFCNLPGGSYYWPGVTGTYWFVDPVNEVICVLLTQTNAPPATPIFQEFHQTFYTHTIYKDDLRAAN
ncbi:MAG: serine hydrolase domain-containing protein, partial [Cyclobacteriaceae bacterium]